MKYLIPVILANSLCIGPSATPTRYFPSEVSGLISQGASLVQAVFRIDRDQAFQSPADLRYQHKNAEWLASTWRYDSGLGGVLEAHAASHQASTALYSVGSN